MKRESQKFSLYKNVIVSLQNASYYKWPFVIPSNQQTNLFILNSFFFLTFSLTCWNPLKHCSSSLKFQTSNFLHHSSLHYPKHIPFLSNSNLYSLTMSEKGNFSTPYMFDDENMQEHFEAHFYRRPITKGRSFDLENFTNFPEVHGLSSKDEEISYIFLRIST